MPDSRASLVSRLWFAWSMLAYAVITPLMWGPWMIALGLWPSARTFWLWMRAHARVVFAVCGFRVKGIREAPAEGAVVYVANHQAMIDIPALTLGIDQPFVFVARGSLRRVPLVGGILRRSRCVFLDVGQQGGAERAMDESAERLASGESVLLFPEGTRSFDGKLKPFRRGSFQLALRAGVPVVPVALCNAHHLLDERERTARPGRLTIRVGAPLPALPDETDRAYAERAREEVARLLASCPA